MPLETTVVELIALGASAGANCRRCLEFHIERARTAGVSDADILTAIDVGTAIRAGAAVQVDEIVAHLRPEANGSRSAAGSGRVPPASSRTGCCG